MERDETKKRKYSQAQNKATQKYIKNNYDSVMVRMPKGKKELIKEYAESKDKSVNSFINESIDRAMQE